MLSIYHNTDALVMVSVSFIIDGGIFLHYVLHIMFLSLQGPPGPPGTIGLLGEIGQKVRKSSMHVYFLCMKSKLIIGLKMGTLVLKNPINDYLSQCLLLNWCCVSLKGPPGKVGEPGLPGEPGEKVRCYILMIIVHFIYKGDIS